MNKILKTIALDTLRKKKEKDKPFIWSKDRRKSWTVSELIEEIEKESEAGEAFVKLLLGDT